MDSDRDNRFPNSPMDSESDPSSTAIEKAEAALDRGEVETALELCGQALERRPEDVRALRLKAIVCVEQDRPGDGVASAQTAVDLNPESVESLFILGWALQEAGKLDEAVSAYDRVLRLDPSNIEALYNTGLIHAEQGRAADAETAFRRALAQDPHHPRVHYSLAELLREHGQPARAIDHYQAALRADGRNAAALRGLGMSYAEGGLRDEALRAYQASAGIDPGDFRTHYLIGAELMSRHDVERSIAAFRRVIEIKPDHGAALNFLVYQMKAACVWAGLPDLSDRLIDLVRTTEKTITPGNFLSLSAGAADNLACARRYARLQKRNATRSAGDVRFEYGRAPGSRRRIGYLSEDFRDHVIGLLVRELIEQADRERFEIVGYAYGPSDDTVLRPRFERACDTFRDINGLSDLDAARLINDDGIDILVDLTGYTGTSRTEIPALRPAPIQVNYLGFPGTMGADFFDYIIVDRYLVPPGYETYYAEQPVFMPDCYQVNPAYRGVDTRPVRRADFNFPEDALVFCCFNNPYKLTPEIFDVWMRLLGTVPDSLLWLCPRSREAAHNLRIEAERRGIDPLRIVFAGQYAHSKYMLQFSIADLYLDTYPYNAGGIAADALWMGLPIVTMSGETYVSRMAGSLLHASGLGELTTTSFDAYEETARMLALDQTRLAGLREHLLNNRTEGVLFDSRRFTRNLERAYEEMWRIYSTGEAPRSITVEPTD